MKYRKSIFLVLASFFLCSCAMMRPTPERTVPTGVEGPPRVYYVGLSGLKLFPSPRLSKDYVARLSLNEKLLRYRIEKGFAYVRVEGTGQTGWVINAHLTWKRGKSKKKASKEAPEDEGEPEQRWAPDYESGGRDASIFDAF